jgi:hypothetical protein
MGIARHLLDVAARLTAGHVAEAISLAREHIPPPIPDITIAYELPAQSREDRQADRTDQPVRALTKQEQLAIWLRDGFVDRYSPERWRLVHPGALRVLSLHLQDAMPTHLSSGLPRSPAVNAALWWDAWPTVDHVVPRVTFGTNDSANLVCTSWWRNAAKSDRTLSATGWELQEPGSLGDWDGLTSWFRAQVAEHDWLARDSFVDKWNLGDIWPARQDPRPEGVRRVYEVPQPIQRDVRTTRRQTRRMDVDRADPARLAEELEQLHALASAFDPGGADYETELGALVHFYREAVCVRRNQRLPGNGKDPEGLTPRDDIYSVVLEHGSDDTYLSLNGRWRTIRTSSGRWTLERIFGGSWQREDRRWLQRDQPVLTLPTGGDFPTSIKALRRAVAIDRRDGLWPAD